MRKKWLLTMITPLLALSLVTGCSMNNNDKEPVEEPLNRDVEDRDMDNNMDRNIEDEDLERDQLDDDLNNDRTNEIDQEDMQK